MARRPREVWIAEAPGYRGSRRTGVPLVSEPLLARATTDLGLSRPLRKATVTPAPVVRTSVAVWEQVAARTVAPLLWNAVLHHPHQPADPFTNRAPTRAERTLFAGALHGLLELVRPDVVVAIGRVAQRSVVDVRPDVVYVRHPSQGGLTAFRGQMAELARGGDAPSGDRR